MASSDSGYTSVHGDMNYLILDPKYTQKLNNDYVQNYEPKEAKLIYETKYDQYGQKGHNDKIIESKIYKGNQCEFVLCSFVWLETLSG